MVRREEEMRRMAGMWEERAIEFRRMWEKALRWERAARAREEGRVVGVIARGGQKEGGSLGGEFTSDSEVGDAE